MFNLRKKTYRVVIDKPCEENWDSMISNANGKYCLHCSKNVIDFTYLSDQQIINLVNKSAEKRCGHFTAEQLNRTLLESKPTSAISKFSKIIASLLLILTTQTMIAQAKRNKLTSASEINLEQNNSSIKPKSRKGAPLPKLNLVMKGKVLDSVSGDILPFSTVFIKNENTSVQTDSSGYFELIIPNRLLKDSLLLIVSNYGYMNKEFIIKKTDISSIKEFFITAQRVVTVEAKTVEHVHRAVGGFAVHAEVKKKKWWQFRK